MKYDHQLKTKVLTKRQIMRFNYDNGFNNTEILADYNTFLIKQISYFGIKENHMNVQANLFNYSQADIVKYFFVFDKSTIDMTGLVPVFILYGIGMTVSLIVFGMEICWYRF